MTNEEPLARTPFAALDYRKILTGIRFVLKTGIAWDDLSPNVPPRYTFSTSGAESSFADVRRAAAWTHGTTPAWCWSTIG